TETGLQATADEARGWFVKEAFSFELLPEGSFVMNNWEGKPILLDEHGRLVVGRSEDAGTPMAIETVQDGIAEAVAAAASAETAMVFVGNSPFINGKETIDRPDITLPPAQQALIQAGYEANPNTVVVIVGGYPFAVNWE
ncbi:beta-glucosidase, partial [Clostridium perfringens]